MTDSAFFLKISSNSEKVGYFFSAHIGFNFAGIDKQLCFTNQRRTP